MERQLYILLLLLAIGQTLFPQTAKDWVNKSLEKAKSKDYEGAISDCNKAISLDTNYADAYNNRGTARFLLGKYEEAIVDLDKAIVLDPQNKRAYYNRGNAEIYLKHYDDAIADYDKAIALDPQYADAYNNRGTIKKALGRYEDAIVDYDHVIALSPKFAIGYNNRGLVKNNLGHYAEAIADFDQAIILFPKYANAYNNRGYAYYKLGNTKANYQKAISDYDMSVQLGGSGYKPGFQYRDSAVAAMEKAVGMFTPKMESTTQIAQNWMSKSIERAKYKDYEGAIADCDSAIALDPKAPDAYNIRGLSNVNLDRYDDAIADFNLAISLVPNNDSLYNNLGYAYFKLGNTIENYRQSIRNYDKSRQLFNKSHNNERHLAPGSAEPPIVFTSSTYTPYFQQRADFEASTKYITDNIVDKISGSSKPKDSYKPNFQFRADAISAIEKIANNFAPIEGKSVVYVMRFIWLGVFGALSTFEVYCDGAYIGSTAGKTYLIAVLNSGKHSFYLMAGGNRVSKKNFEFYLEPRKVYFLKQGVDRINVISEEEGKKYFHECKLSEGMAY